MKRIPCRKCASTRRPLFIECELEKLDHGLASYVDVRPCCYEYWRMIFLTQNAVKRWSNFMTRDTKGSDHLNTTDKVISWLEGLAEPELKLRNISVLGRKETG